jgi:hypothetical protein
MIDEQRLRLGLQKLLTQIDAAIRDRLDDEPSLQSQLRERHTAAVRAERTEGSAKGYTAFSDEAITQAAAHWLLGCVFVRFLEDNGWLDERSGKVAWIAGPGERLAIAKDRRSRFLRPDPGLTDRDYLIHVFVEAAKLPGVAGLFDPKHNPLFWLQPTAQGAAKIVEFFQKVDPDSNILIHDFSDPAHGTRFLGDLYQNLSESARKRYALCQTPSFVINFILDRTLTPALDAFGLETVRMIDPSCGSGHFLLEVFARLIRAWKNKEPGTNMPALVQRSLDAVYGVDLNPFAVEITRFRLLISALESSEIQRLKSAPNFKFNLASGDSLLHGSRVGGGGIQRGLLRDRMEHFYDTEDAEELERILSQPYHVVIGNPPYINVKDSILREAYRNRFATCHGQYQMGVPFTERFFDLTIASDDQGLRAGWMGMIVSNAFMKRGFGKKLVEEYLRNKNLTHVIDTSGINLSGHGTPTAILLGRNQQPLETSPIRAVLGKIGILHQAEDQATSPVWREIVEHTDEVGFEGSRISVVDASRSQFSRHPWTIGGGGASELRQLIEGNAPARLYSVVSDIGAIGRSSADEAFVATSLRFQSAGVSDRLFRQQATGDSVRDWQLGNTEAVLFPYGEGVGDPLADCGFLRWLWPYRTILGNRATFSHKTYFQEGRAWWSWHQLSPQRLRPSSSIAYGEIATHNHFVLSNGTHVFNQTAPVIKLSEDSADSEYHGLLGVLNSSVACFWLRQVCHSKGGGGVGGGLAAEPWERFICIDSTKLKQFPVSDTRPAELARSLQMKALNRSDLLPALFRSNNVLSRDSLATAQKQSISLLQEMISIQEEIDWKCYSAYGLCDDDLSFPGANIPPLRLGERAFEIHLARNGEETSWYERHRSKPILELPSDWPKDYRDLVERRLIAIDNNSDIALMERPEYKRRWNTPAWQALESAALKTRLLDRVEANSIWKEHRLVSCSQLRDVLALDHEWISIAEIYNGSPVEDLDRFVIQLALPEGVSFLPILKYTEAGLRKRAEWEEVWRLQREEDAGITHLDIPAPPKYVAKDFKSGDFWRLRGGLDVPKERFILYPFFQRDSDASPVLGWAGWSYLDQARSLAAYYQRMRTEEGWEPERLKPILAGLLDLKPWLLQWHNELDSEMGERLGEYFVRYAESQCQEFGFSPEEVLAWQPPARSMAPGGRKKTS